MPKISTKYIRIQEGDVDENFQINVMYNTELKFYAEVPASLEEGFDQLTEQEAKIFCCRRKYKYKYQTTGEHKKLVTGDTEGDVMKHMRALATKLFTLKLIKEPVIMVYYENVSSDRNDIDLGELRKIGLTFRVVYCVRVRTHTTTRYYKYSEYKFGGETSVSRREINVYRNDPELVIDDTPDNRKFLEDLHGALSTLITKLEEFTKSKESLLSVIQKNTKLLTLTVPQ